MPHTRVRVKKSASRSSSQVSKWSQSVKTSAVEGTLIFLFFFIKGAHARSSRWENSFQPSTKCKYFPPHLTISGSSVWLINVLIFVIKARKVRPSNQEAAARKEGCGVLHGERRQVRITHRGGDERERNWLRSRSRSTL